MLPPAGPSVAKRPTMHRKRTSEQSADDSSETASASGSIDTKSKSRDRIGMACVHCRHRKIKCDGQPTCATCLRLKRKCEYEAVTEFQNMLSRDRKRRNKEIKQARAAALSIFADPASRSMGPPSGPLTAPIAPFSDQFRTDFFGPLPSADDNEADSQSEVSIRRRRGISLTHPAPSHVYAELAASQQTIVPSLLSSVSQPTTPSGKPAHQYYQSLATASPHTLTFPLPDYALHSYPGHQTFGSPSGLAAAYPSQQAQTEPTSPVFGTHSDFTAPQLVRSSTSEADYQTGYINLADAHTVVPTSAHVRPVDLPAPHGHYDYATLPFPSQSAFLAEAPFITHRRRSSIHLPVGHADSMRRPSVAEAATVTLMQRVADKRESDISLDTKQLAHELVTGNPGSSTGIAAWNAQVQSHHPETMMSWAAYQTPDMGADSFDYVALSTPTARSNSDGLLSLGPLSPPNNITAEGVKRGSHPDGTSTASHSSVSSSNGDTTYVDGQRANGYFSTASGSLTDASLPFSLSALNASTSDCVKQQGWAAFQNQAGPMLSPVSDLNNMFGTFGVLTSPPTPQANSNDYSRQFSHQHYQHLYEQQQSPTHHRSRSQTQHHDTSTLASAFGSDLH